MKKSQFYMLMIILVIICAFPTFGGLGNIAVQEHFYWIPFIINIGVYGYLLYLLNKMRKEAEAIEIKEAKEKLKEMMKKDSANHHTRIKISNKTNSK